LALLRRSASWGKGTGRTGALVGNLKRTQDPVLWVWLKIFFTAQRYHFENNTLSPVLFFLHNSQKGTSKARAVNLNIVPGIPSHSSPEWCKLQGRNLKFSALKSQSETFFSSVLFIRNRNFKSCARTCRSVDVKLGICSCPCICDLFIQNQKVEIRGSHPPDCCATSSVLRHVCIVHLLTELGAFVIDISYLDH